MAIPRKELCEFIYQMVEKAQGKKNLKAMDVQKALGSDIMMTFDECAPFPADHEYVANAVRLHIFSD